MKHQKKNPKKTPEQIRERRIKRKKLKNGGIENGYRH